MLISIYPKDNLNYLLKRDPFQATESAHQIKCNLTRCPRALILFYYWPVMLPMGLLPKYLRMSESDLDGGVKLHSISFAGRVRQQPPVAW